MTDMGKFVDVKFEDMKLLCKALRDSFNNGKTYKVSD